MHVCMGRDGMVLISDVWASSLAFFFLLSLVFLFLVDYVRKGIIGMC
jgi:hypothetical protein